MQRPRTIYESKGQTTCHRTRRGATVLETAIAAPIVFLVLLASIQFCGILMSQNVVTAAAREGARIASMPSTDLESTVTARVADRLQRGNIAPGLATVTVAPLPLADLGSGDQVTVTVSVPMRQISWLNAVVLPESNLSSVITCTRE